VRKQGVQERAARIHAFFLQLEALAREGVLDLTLEQKEGLAAHHEALLRRQWVFSESREGRKRLRVVPRGEEGRWKR